MNGRTYGHNRQTILAIRQAIYAAMVDNVDPPAFHASVVHDLINHIEEIRTRVDDIAGCMSQLPDLLPHPDAETAAPIIADAVRQIFCDDDDDPHAPPRYGMCKCCKLGVLERIRMTRRLVCPRCAWVSK